MLESSSTLSQALQAAPLTAMVEGAVVMLRDTNLADADRQLLVALGMIPNRRLLVRKTGSPWIVEVCGVRIGLSKAIAEQVLVEPLEEAEDGSPAPG